MPTYFAILGEEPHCSKAPKVGPPMPMRFLIYYWLPVTKTNLPKDTVMANSRGVHLLALFSMSSDLNREVT